MSKSTTMKKEVSPYTKSSPSPRYSELLGLYQQHHDSGRTKSWSRRKTVYPGKSLIPFLGFVRALCLRHDVSKILDYGAGKGLQYTDLRVKEAGKPRIYKNVPQYWGVDVQCYDPGNEDYITMPEGQFEGVVSTDVLEHCPEEDLPWIIEEMFSKATKFVFANIACYPAKTILPNGENAHATIKPPEWWQVLIEDVAKDYPRIAYYFVATPDKTKFGTLITNDKIEIDAPLAGALPGSIVKAYWTLIARRLGIG